MLGLVKKCGCLGRNFSKESDVCWEGFVINLVIDDVKYGIFT